MATGNVQDEKALLGKYRVGFTGRVLTDFSKPSSLEIRPGYAADGNMREPYGYGSNKSHPTPESPNYGAVYKK